MGNIQITCDGMAINRVTTVKYLGVTLDQHFRFDHHVSDMINRCAGRIAFLYRNSNFLDFECRRILCNSLIQPYIDYCCSSWYSSISQRLRDRLDVLQRRMVKFIMSKDRLYHVSSQDLRDLSWLSVYNRVRFFKLNQVFRIHMGTAPWYLSSNFRLISQSHGHNTRRSSHDYFVSRELANSPCSFAYTAVKHWNSLPRYLKDIDSFGTFKTRLKDYLSS